MNQRSPIRFAQKLHSARLYDHIDFATAKTRDVVPHELIHYTGKALLMAAQA